MIKNAKSLKDQAKNMAKQNNISIQQVLQNYMFERILERLSRSKYKENFIIKGGLLLSSETLENNPFLNRLWLDYSKKHEYSKNVSFNDTIKAIQIIEETVFSNNEFKLLAVNN